MLRRTPANMLSSTRKPLGLPGTSSNTTQGPFSSRRIASAASPMSSCQLAPLTLRTSPSSSARVSHSRRSSYAMLAATLLLAALVLSFIPKTPFRRLLRLLRRLDPEHLGDVGKLFAHLLNACREFRRAANVDDLGGGGEALRDGRVGIDDGPDVRCDLVAQRVRHAARAIDADQAVHAEEWKARLRDGRNVG